MIYLKLLVLFLFTVIFSQDFNGNIAITGQLPQGEFKEEGVPKGIGVDINGMYYPVKALAFGLNFGGSSYGFSEREIPFSYYSSAVTITEKTSNEMSYGHLLFQIIPFQGNIKPYVEGLFGLKNLSTRTELVSNNCDEKEYDNCQIAESENASDAALSYGVGLGLEISIASLEKIGYEYKDDEDNLIESLSFFINGRYLWGGKTKYLKQGTVEYSDPSVGPVETTFNWSESYTDLLQISVGLSLRFSLLED